MQAIMQSLSDGLGAILGALPAFVGWGIVRAVVVAWSVPRRGRAAYDAPPQQLDG